MAIAILLSAEKPKKLGDRRRVVRGVPCLKGVWVFRYDTVERVMSEADDVEKHTSEVVAICACEAILWRKLDNSTDIATDVPERCDRPSPFHIQFVNES